MFLSLSYKENLQKIFCSNVSRKYSYYLMRSLLEGFVLLVNMLD